MRRPGWPELILPPAVAPHARGRRPARRHPVHVPGRAGAERRRCCASTAHAIVAISHASIVVPVRCSARRWRCSSTRACRTRDVPFTSFALFMGVAMSITAFPVLARILTDRELTQDRARRRRAGLRRGRRRDGVVPAGARGRRRAGAASERRVAVVARAARLASSRLMFARSSARWWRLVAGSGIDETAQRRASWRVVVRGAARCRRWRPRRSASTPSSARSCSARSSRTTAACARDARRTGCEDLVTVLLLPAFFAFTGMRTQIGLVDRRDRLADLRPDHPRRDGRQVRRHASPAARLTGLGLARLPRGLGVADEHARPDGADRAEHRPAT